MSVNVLISLAAVSAQAPISPVCNGAQTLEQQGACCRSLLSRFDCLSVPFCAFAAAHVPQLPPPPCPACPGCPACPAQPMLPPEMPPMPPEMPPMPPEMPPPEMPPPEMPPPEMPPPIDPGMPPEMVPPPPGPPGPPPEDDWQTFDEGEQLEMDDDDNPFGEAFLHGVAGRRHHDNGRHKFNHRYKVGRPLPRRYNNHARPLRQRYRRNRQRGNMYARLRGRRLRQHQLQLDANEFTRQAPEMVPMMPDQGSCLAWTEHGDTCGEWADNASRLDAPGQLMELICPSEADKIVKPLPLFYVGSASVFHKDSRQTLPPPFQAAPGPVFAFTGTPSANGGHPIVTRISGVDATKFNLRIQEPGCFDGRHKQERVDFMAVGLQAAVNNDHFTLGYQVLTKGPSGWQAVVTFPPGFFQRKPIVIPQLQIPENINPIAPPGMKAKARSKLQRELDYVSPRLMSVDENGFTVYLQHGTKATAYEPPLDATNQPAVQLAWIAFKQTDGEELLATVAGHHKFIARRFSRGDKSLRKKNRGINHRWQTYRYNTQFVNPLVFAYTQSALGPDAISVRMRRNRPTSVQLHLQESRRKCRYDNRHTREDLGFIIIDAAPVQ